MLALGHEDMPFLPARGQAFCDHLHPFLCVCCQSCPTLQLLGVSLVLPEPSQG